MWLQQEPCAQLQQKWLALLPAGKQASSHELQCSPLEQNSPSSNKWPFQGSKAISSTLVSSYGVDDTPIMEAFDQTWQGGLRTIARIMQQRTHAITTITTKLKLTLCVTLLGGQHAINSWMYPVKNTRHFQNWVATIGRESRQVIYWLPLSDKTSKRPSRSGKQNDTTLQIR